MKKYRLTFNGTFDDGEIPEPAQTGPWSYVVEAVDEDEARRMAQLCLGIEIYASERLSELVSVEMASDDAVPDLERALTWGMHAMVWHRDDANKIVGLHMEHTKEPVAGRKFFVRALPADFVTAVC